MVLLDWAMPIMNGDEALRSRILAEDPAAQVVMSSGYAEPDRLGRGPGLVIADFIQSRIRLRSWRRSCARRFGDGVSEVVVLA